MSAAAINSASAHRTGKKQLNENRKSVVSRANINGGPHGNSSVMHSLINDESILSQQLTGKAINHSSLIVDSAQNQRLAAEASILS